MSEEKIVKANLKWNRKHVNLYVKKEIIEKLDYIKEFGNFRGRSEVLNFLIEEYFQFILKNNEKNENNS